jgi:MoxR-like ATPase
MYQMIVLIGNLTTLEDTHDEQALLEKAKNAHAELHRAVASRVVGQERVVDLMLVALLARGHALLVGVPGLAKTLLVATLSEALELSFGRVQFTPDLLPADITGTDVLHEEEEGGGVRQRVRFMPGPIFHNLILADEINRTPPKTQAALLQAMQERRVTVGTDTHTLPDPFQVFATRNPIEQEGTYPLPEAQLDRFLLEIHVDYPSENEEQQIARKTTSADFGKDAVPHVLNKDDLKALQSLVPRMPITDEAVSLAVTLTRKTRPSAAAATAVNDYVRFGAGPRGSQALVLASKARAALRGHAAADVEDIRALTVPVLRHRLVMSYRAESDGVSEEDLLSQL